jgi:hypothetical protein
VTVAARVFVFSVLPLALAFIHVRFSQGAQNRLWKIEVYLIYLFLLGVGASGLSGFFGHVFVPDVVADSIDWERGSPFQQEMGFANLAVGILGLIAAGRRDGFREATVVAVTVLGVGASVVHMVDLVQTGNLAPGNSIQLFANLIKPGLLIPLLMMSRRTALQIAATPSFDDRRGPVIGTAGAVTGVVGTAFGLGFAFDQVVPAALAGSLVAATVTVLAARKPPPVTPPLVSTGRSAPDS